jgi:hypothetical protein
VEKHPNAKWETNTEDAQKKSPKNTKKKTEKKKPNTPKKKNLNNKTQTRKEKRY